MTNMKPRYNPKHYNWGVMDYDKGIKLKDCPFGQCRDGMYDSWRAGWKDASKHARGVGRFLMVNAGDRCKWRNEYGHIEFDVVSHVYTSAMGHLCAEMKSGRKVKVSELFDVQEPKQ